MEENVITYGNVPFADIKIGNIVKVGDYSNVVAIGIVEEKREAKDYKSVGVRFGFSDKLENVIIEKNNYNGATPMYELLEIVRSFA